MALIKERKDKTISSGSYERIFGNKELAQLITKIQGTSIVGGNELEQIILNQCSTFVLKEVSEFENILNRNIELKNDIFLGTKKIIKKSTVKNKKEPDFLIIKFFENKILIIELKDGWVFDTKKSLSEYEQLINFQNDISKIISYKTEIYICSFNNNNKTEIYNGLKRKVPIEYIMTGAEFCKILKLNYNFIYNERQKHAKENFNYFIDELLKIDEVKNLILNKLKI